jgi:glycosyltransferase involved in cell wall biosynthesis
VTLWVFYSNDPLAEDQGGGAEHFRGLHRALASSGLDYRLIGARLQYAGDDPRIVYLSRGSHFLRWWLALWPWTWRHRAELGPGDLCHVHRPYAALPLLLLTSARLVLTYHNVSGRVLEGVAGRLGAPLRWLMLLAERWVVARAAAIVCVSERDRRELARTVAPVPFARARVIPAAFDAAVFERHGPSAPLPRHAHRVLVLGRLSRQKNLPLALDSFAAAAADGGPWRLTIAGDGEEAAALDRLIAVSPARERIRRIGVVPHAQVPGLLASHGILLLTSRYEASPTVVKEAIAALRPVVTTDVGDVADWLIAERTGFIRPAEAAALADGLRAAAAAITSGAFARESVVIPSETEIMGRVIALYRELLAH